MSVPAEMIAASRITFAHPLPVAFTPNWLIRFSMAHFDSVSEATFFFVVDFHGRQLVAPLGRV